MQPDANLCFAPRLSQLVVVMAPFSLATRSRISGRTSPTRLEDEAARRAGAEVLWEVLNFVHYHYVTARGDHAEALLWMKFLLFWDRSTSRNQTARHLAESAYAHM